MKKIKLQSKFDTSITTYFKVFSTEHAGCFWHSINNEESMYELSRMEDWTPINSTWSEIIENEKTLS